MKLVPVIKPAAAMVAVAMAAFGLASMARGIDVSPAKSKSVEDMLKEAGLLYRPLRTPDGRTVGFQVAVEIGGKSSTILMGEETTPMHTRDGSSVNRVRAVAVVKSFEREQNLSPALLRKIVDINDSIKVGRVSADSKGVYVGDGFFTPMSTEVFAIHLATVHFLRHDVGEQVASLLNAESLEK